MQSKGSDSLLGTLNSVCLDWSRRLLVSPLRRKHLYTNHLFHVLSGKALIWLKPGNILSVFCCMHWFAVHSQKCTALQPGKTRGSHTCCVRYSMQSYNVVPGCDMLKLHFADYVYSRACTCSSQSVLYQLVREENKDRKATPCFVQKRTIAALHVTLQRNRRQLRLTRLME